MTDVFVSDFAGANDSLQTVVNVFLFDSGAGNENITSAETRLSKSLMVSVNSFTSLTSSVTVACNAGAPYQGNMRQLALGRWNYMYAS